MLNSPLISILVPVYNVEKYLRQCLESIVNQSLKDIEIICINDGSTDSSLNILKEYSSKDSRIIIINKKNTGYGNTMNIGLVKAKGKYIGIVESDDFAELDMFEELYNVAEKNNVDIIKSNYFAYKNSEQEEKIFLEILKNCRYNTVFSPAEEEEIFFTAPSIWSALYKRKFLINNSIYFNETPGASYQDTSFAFKCLALASKVYLVNKAYLNYRVDNMASSVSSSEKIFCVCDEHNEIKRFLQNYPEKDLQLREIKFVMKYRTYKWNYNRLISAYQYTFLLKMYTELQKEFKEEYLDSTYLLKSEVEDLRNLFNDMKEYFKLTSKDFNDDRLLSKHTLNSKIYLSGLLSSIDDYEKVIIYGSGIIGKKVARFLINNNKQIFSFAISNSNINKKIVMDINVQSIESFLGVRDSSVILVAVKEKDQFDIISNLKTLNFNNIISVDSVLLNEMDK